MSKPKRRLTNIKRPKGKAPKKSSLYVDADLAQLVRRVASAEGRMLTPVIHDMLELYLSVTHADWVRVYDDGHEEDGLADVAAGGILAGPAAREDPPKPKRRRRKKR